MFPGARSVLRCGGLVSAREADTLRATSLLLSIVLFFLTAGSSHSSPLLMEWYPAGAGFKANLLSAVTG